MIPLGVDDVFRPPAEPRVPGRIVAMASADTPMKGIATLLEAFAKLRTERDAGAAAGLAAQARRPDRADRRPAGHRRAPCASCTASPTRSSPRSVGSAEMACVPSLYEGFSLPTAEAMACATPLVVSRAGAIPEVVGPDGLCADLVTPGDVGELAHALAALLDDPERRARMGAAGRRACAGRVQLACGGRGDRAPPTSRRSTYDEERAVLTVDFDRLGLRPGDRVLDMGCGAGRHAFEMYRRGGDVVAFDQDGDELAGVLDLFGAMRDAGEVPDGAEADIKQGDALRCRSRTASSTGWWPRRCSSTSPRTRRDRRAGPGAAPRRHDGA